MILKITLLVWSVCLEFIFLLRVLSWYLLPLKLSPPPTPLNNSRLREIKKKRDKKTQCYLFICSSAGEYEQAKPLLRKLKSTNTYIHILFFSHSGFTFAKKLGETIEYSRLPPDSIWRCKKILSILRPTMTIVIRHEIWPAFLSISRKYGPNILINRTFTENKKRNRIEKALYEFYVKIFSLFDRIYVVSKNDLTHQAQTPSLKTLKMVVAGDTKYDRALERARERKAISQSLKKRLKPYLKDQALIVGSAWIEDLKVIIASLQHMKSQKSLCPTAVISFHEITESRKKWLTDMCQRNDLSLGVLCEESQDPAHREFDVLLVEELGILAELYSCGTFSFVGGASHFKVHNVLEPAAYQLPIAFGPRYKNSQEAIRMIDSGRAKVIQSAVQMADWIKHEKELFEDQKYHGYLEKNSGCSLYIASQLQQLTAESP